MLSLSITHEDVGDAPTHFIHRSLISDCNIISNPLIPTLPLTLILNRYAVAWAYNVSKLSNLIIIPKWLLEIFLISRTANGSYMNLGEIR
jgi:hypothetical protein